MQPRARRHRRRRVRAARGRADGAAARGPRMARAARHGHSRRPGARRARKPTTRRREPRHRRAARRRFRAGRSSSARAASARRPARRRSACACAQAGSERRSCSRPILPRALADVLGAPLGGSSTAGRRRADLLALPARRRSRRATDFSRGGGDVDRRRSSIAAPTSIARTFGGLVDAALPGVDETLALLALADLADHGRVAARRPGHRADRSHAPPARASRNVPRC